MKKSLIALAVLAASGAAMAQSSVTLFGIVDTGTDPDHPDLVNNIKYNYADPVNGIDDDGDGYIDNYTGWDMADGDNNTLVAATGGGNPSSLAATCACTPCRPIV